MRFISRSLAVLLLCGISFAQQKVNLDTGVKGSLEPYYGADSGAANAYVITTNAVLGPTLRTGSKFYFFAANANTGASTANVDSTGAISIVKNVSTALASGDIPAGGIVELIYDGTNFQCTSCGLNAGGSSFYQTVQANGTDQTQRGKLNLKSGTNTTISCSDNSGSNSTDCTVDASGSGISSGGPTFIGKLCSFIGGSSPATSYGCSAGTFNLVANETIFNVCMYFTNGGGAGTIGSSDTAGLTWTKVTGASVFNATTSRGIAIFSANTGSTTGADSFNCTNSVNMSFSNIAVMGFLGASASPVDASNSANSSTSNTSFSLSVTSTSGNDLILFFADYAGTGTSVIGFMTQIFLDTSNAGFVFYEPIGAATTYYAFASFGGAYSCGIVAIH